MRQPPGLQSCRAPGLPLRGAPRPPRRRCPRNPIVCPLNGPAAIFHPWRASRSRPRQTLFCHKWPTNQDQFSTPFKVCGRPAMTEKMLKVKLEELRGSCSVTAVRRFRFVLRRALGEDAAATLARKQAFSKMARVVLPACVSNRRLDRPFA